MGILQENNINLEKVASDLGLKVVDLIALDNEGETRLFDNVMECFKWLFIENYKRVENVAPTMLEMAKLNSKDFKGTVAEVMVGEQNTSALDDGRVVFVYL